MRGRLALALCLGANLTLAMGGVAVAEQQPAASKHDGRIRFVSYNNADVVKVDTLAGVATLIQLEEGETYVTHAFGDAEAWSFAMEKHHVFIKPRADRADTNLILVTDRRTYNFNLVYHKAAPAPVVFQLTFHYPDTAAKKAAARSKQATVEAAMRAPHGPVTTDYTMAGDRSIAPLNVWDDSRFTYFKFPGNRDMPAIYMVDADGREAIVNRSVEGELGDTVVVQKVNEKWRLRLGGQVLSIFNEKLVAAGDAPIATNRDAATGTRSPVVVRVVRGGE